MSPFNSYSRKTLADFVSWLADSRPGDTIEYYRGFLVLDRDEGLSTLAADRRRQVISVADAAFDAAGEGRVHLVQRRLEPHCFSYLAIRRDTGLRPTSSYRNKSRPVRPTACATIPDIEPHHRSSGIDQGRSDVPAETDAAIVLQVEHVRSRYAVSRSRALVIAEHAFGAGGRP